MEQLSETELKELVTTLSKLKGDKNDNKMERLNGEIRIGRRS